MRVAIEKPTWESHYDRSRSDPSLLKSERMFWFLQEERHLATGFGYGPRLCEGVAGDVFLIAQTLNFQPSTVVVSDCFEEVTMKQSDGHLRRM